MCIRDSYSYYLNLYLNLNTYVYTFIISAFLAIIFSLIDKNNENKITIYSKIITIIFGYFLLPLIISIPFYFSNYNLTFIDSYFESISGFTSTGFTIFDNVKHIDQGLILWRSSSPVSYTHLRAHETDSYLVCRLLLEKKTVSA